MRGSDKRTGSLFSYVDLEERVPARHPLRKIKSVVDAALVSLDAYFELGQGSRTDRQDDAARPRPRRCPVHVDYGCLQSRAAAETACRLSEGKARHRTGANDAQASVETAGAPSARFFSDPASQGVHGF